MHGRWWDPLRSPHWCRHPPYSALQVLASICRWHPTVSLCHAPRFLCCIAGEWWVSSTAPTHMVRCIVYVACFSCSSRLFVSLVSAMVHICTTPPRSSRLQLTKACVLCAMVPYALMDSNTPWWAAGGLLLCASLMAMLVGRVRALQADVRARFELCT